MLELVPLLLMLLAVVGYAAGLTRLHRRGDRWPSTRTACMLTGSLCVAAAVLPPASSHDELFPVHIGQHLLLGMTGPLFLALSAPVTLALRALPRRPRRGVLRLLHSRSVAVISAPATAVAVDLGALYVLYLTGLYRAAERDDLIHALVHLHMFLAGCLLSWAIIAVDPVRRRPSTRVRLAALIIAGAGHDTLAKLMYARNLPAGAGSIADRHAGAELMYYGGTIIDLALAIIVMAQWYQATGRELGRAARRSAQKPADSAPSWDRPARTGKRIADREAGPAPREPWWSRGLSAKPIDPEPPRNSCRQLQAPGADTEDQDLLIAAWRRTPSPCSRRSEGGQTAKRAVCAPLVPPPTLSAKCS